MKLNLAGLEFDFEDPILEEGELPNGILVLVRTSMPDHNTKLISMIDGIDWLTARGMLKTADELLRDADEGDRL